MDEYKNPEILDQNEIKCKNCSAKLEFAPGTTSLKCPYCGTVNEIKVDEEKLKEALKEIDYYAFINNMDNSNVEKEEETFIKCTSCGAETSFSGNVISAECPFCGTPLVKEQSQIKSVITPSAVVPFKITQKQAIEEFNNWIKKSFWMPGKAKQYARPDRMQGIYTPYWTYDANTVTDYKGRRGDDYKVTETYTASDGTTQTRTVTKTRWRSVSGRVYVNFDDVMVVASDSLPTKHVQDLEPWNLSELLPYDKKFLAGFKSESYDKDVKKGFEEAQTIMSFKIEEEIRRDIGGDHQHIISKETSYNDVTFKHVLLPIWLSSFRYKNKVYRFVVNGQTGKVKGERPVSVMKIILVVLLVIAVIAVIAYFSQQ